jgi:hypothetical protein
MVSPLERKANYVNDLASTGGIDLSMLNLGALLKQLYLSIDFNLLFRFFLDLYLSLNLNMDFNLFKFWNFNFTTGLQVVLPTAQKGIYGVTYYDVSYYDPPDTTDLDLENSVWWMREHTTERDVPQWKKKSDSMKDYLTIIKQRLQAKGVSAHYTDAMESLLAMVEGKVTNSAFVGFAIVGFAKVMHDEGDGTSSFDARKHTDWETVWNLKASGMYDSIVGIAQVGYSRVGAINLKPTKEMADRFITQVNQFKARAGQVTGEYPMPAYPPFPYGYTPTYPSYPSPYPPSYPSGYGEVKPELLYPRIFMLQRVDQYHWTGGKYQIKSQVLINRVKEILDEVGIIVGFRLNYLAYAQEIYYLDHQGHRLYKGWKRVLNRDDVRQKYLAMGLDGSVLDKIDAVVG